MPPIPAAVAEGAAKFQNTVASTFGRKLQSAALDSGLHDAANASGDPFMGRYEALPSQAQLQQELLQHEAQLRAVLADQQHL